MSGGLDEHLGSAFLSQLIMRDRTMHDGNVYQVLLRIFNTLGNCFLHFLGLTQAMSDHTILVADYDQCGETECPAAFCRFYHAIDRHHLFLQLQIAGFNSV